MPTFAGQLADKHLNLTEEEVLIRPVFIRATRSRPNAGANGAVCAPDRRRDRTARRRDEEMSTVVTALDLVRSSSTIPLPGSIT